MTQHLDSHLRGEITLVGAGPGDPELITLAGVRALAEADMVIYDRLVHPDLLNHAAKGELIYAGKTPGEPHAATQRWIIEQMIEHASRGKRVVRLKGGDPSVFGRGGEETEAARAAGIPVRVIPGVTACLGAVAQAGFPLTHRGMASSVAMVTGCPAADDPMQAPDWQALARSVDTIVIYMGVRRLPRIARELLAGGRPPEQPVAVIENATLPDRRIRRTSLCELGALDPDQIKSPAMIVVGEVVNLGEPMQALVERTMAECRA